MSQDLIGDWTVYRYNQYSRHVLKSCRTTLNVTRTGTGLVGSFELNGWDERVEVEMLFDTTTQAWYGEEDSVDLCWSAITCSGTKMLIGYAVDRSNGIYFDSFVAVKAPRTVELPVEELGPNISFASSYVTHLKRSKGGAKQWGGISVDLQGQDGEQPSIKWTIHGEEKTYWIKKPARPYEGGLRLTGDWHAGEEEESRIELWILPLDETGHLLAIGNYTDHMPMSAPFSGPGPECGFTVHAC